MTWPVALGAMYAIGVLLLLTRLAWQMGKVKRLWHEAMPVDAEWSALLAECAREFGIQRPVRLLRTAAQTMPTAFGILEETVVIPANADNWSADRRRAVMLHELAHVERRDCLTQMVASVACVVYWPHPAVWWMAHRLRVERELACDDLVLSVGTSPRDYAGHLLDIAYTLRTTIAPALSVSMANPRQLERRMRALLDASRNRATLHVRSRLAVALLGAALVGAVAAPTVSASDEGDPLTTALPAQATPSAGTALRPGMWEIRPVTEPGQVHVRMRDERGFHGHNIDIDRLNGLTPSLLTGAGGVTGFSIRHDAGTFTFEGVFRNGVGSGTFAFTPDNGFAQTMVARGYDRPATNQLAMLARQDVGTAFLDELIALEYRQSTLAQIVRAVEHGIDSAYLRDMGNLGYRVGTIDTLIDMRDHGVSPQYVQGMTAEGLTGLSAWDLIKARDHGVSPQYIADMGQLGLRLITLDALVNARDHGVSAEYVRGMRDEGFALTVDELIRARDHGVSVEYLRDMRDLGYRLGLDQLIWARDHGVSAEYVRDLRGLGYQTLTLDTLIRLRDHGISPGYIDDLARIGYARLTVEELVSLRDHGVSPDEVRRANARAGTRLPVNRLLQLADGGWRQSRQELRFTSKLSSLL
jgi:beta-lactamase regulating signal transducer with metallopeptidase domain